MGRIVGNVRVPNFMNNLGFVGGIIQVSIVILFCLFTEYDSSDYSEGQYGMFQDVNVMIMVGFGFLFCLLPRYGWSAISIVMITAAMTILWNTLCTGWVLNMWNTNNAGFGWWPTANTVPSVAGTAAKTAGWWKINVTMGLLMNGVFAAAAMLIALGCILGRSSVQQVVLMMFFMIPVYVSRNSYLPSFYICFLGCSKILYFPRVSGNGFYFHKFLSRFFRLEINTFSFMKSELVILVVPCIFIALEPSSAVLYPGCWATTQSMIKRENSTKIPTTTQTYLL